jgi:hypothetical protein
MQMQSQAMPALIPTGKANVPGEATKDNAGEIEVEASKDAGGVPFKK